MTVREIRRRTGRLALAVALVAASHAAAFGQGAPPSGGTGGKKGHVPSELEKKACTYVTTAEVSAAFKTEMNEGNASGDGLQGACNFFFKDGSGRSVVISLKTSPGARMGFLQKRSDGESVYGLGSEAVWIANYSTLLVLTRDNHVVEIDLTTAASALKRVPAKDVATSLARKVLSRI